MFGCGSKEEVLTLLSMDPEESTTIPIFRPPFEATAVLQLGSWARTGVERVSNRQLARALVNIMFERMTLLSSDRGREES